jgi:hypothetical protein
MAMPFLEGDKIRFNWRKSSRSVNGGNCTEVASTSGIIVVRDSQDPDTLVLPYPVNTWRSFVTAVRAGIFDSLS